MFFRQLIFCKHNNKWKERNSVRGIKITTGFVIPIKSMENQNVLSLASLDLLETQALTPLTLTGVVCAPRDGAHPVMTGA